MTSPSAPTTTTGLIIPVEYSLHLDTGERILVSEFDPELVPELADEATRLACAHVLIHATYAPRDVVEEAKRGLDARFKKALRSSGIGCLMKAARPNCALRRSCQMAAPGCTLRNASGSGGDFPDCWTYEGGSPAAEALGSAVARSWREGRYAVLVMERP